MDEIQLFYAKYSCCTWMTDGPYTCAGRLLYMDHPSTGTRRRHFLNHLCTLLWTSQCLEGLPLVCSAGLLTHVPFFTPVPEEGLEGYSVPVLEMGGITLNTGLSGLSDFPRSLTSLPPRTHGLFLGQPPRARGFCGFCRFSLSSSPSPASSSPHCTECTMPICGSVRSSVIKL
jgi:hypothetical protein